MDLDRMHSGSEQEQEQEEEQEEEEEEEPGTARRLPRSILKGGWWERPPQTERGLGTVSNQDRFHLIFSPHACPTNTPVVC